MKVIDLLNKIANKEEVPKKIKVLFNVFVYDEDNYKYRNIDEEKDDLFEHLEFYKGIALNDEINIIEDTSKEDKITKIGKLNQVSDKQHLNNYILRNKINEIIDRLNGEE